MSRKRLLWIVCVWRVDVCRSVWMKMGTKRDLELLSTCSDDTEFVGVDGYGCDFWNGRDCRGRADQGVEDITVKALVARCPRACHVCEVAQINSTNNVALTLADEVRLFVASDHIGWRSMGKSGIATYPTLGLRRMKKHDEEELEGCYGNSSLPYTSIGEASSSQLLSSCQDDISFRDVTNETCDVWPMFNCHIAFKKPWCDPEVEIIFERCPATCGLCANHLTKETLLSRCMDDPNFRDESKRPCMYYSRNQCNDQSRERCPYSCHICIEPYVRIGNESDAELMETCQDDQHFRHQAPLIAKYSLSRRRRGNQGCEGFELLQVLGEDDQVIYGCDRVLEPRNVHEDGGWTEAGAAAIKARCPRACGLCVRLPPKELAARCEDEFHTCDVLGSMKLVRDVGCVPALLRLPFFDYFMDDLVVTKFLADNKPTALLKIYHDFCPKTCGRCQRCQSGYIENRSFVPSHSQFCQPCAPGKFASLAGLTVCNDCPAGRYTTYNLSTDCQNCPRDEYSLSGSLNCLPCPPNSVAPIRGTPRCKADFGYFLNSTTMYSFEACGNGKTTIVLGADSKEYCLCPQDTYYDRESDWCLPCLDGLLCSGDQKFLGDTPLTTRFGFHALYSPARNFAIVYKCIPAQSCQGQDTCGENLDPAAVACASCLPDHYLYGETCRSCSVADKWSSFFACLGGMLFLSCAVIFLSTPEMNASLSSKIEIGVVGIAVSTVQSLSIFGQMSVDWVTPLSSIFEFMKLFSFDLTFLRISCLLGSDANQPAYSYLRRAACVPIAVGVIASSVSLKLVVCEGRRQQRSHSQKRVLATVYNAIGNVFLIFFIGLCVLAFLPFQCYSHPTPGYSSVLAYPEVLCWRGGPHKRLLVGCGLIMCGFLFPGLSICVYATNNYRRAAALGNNHFMRAHAFLFSRVKPSRYRCALPMMLRGLLLVLATTCFPSDVDVQILLTGAILFGSATLIASYHPWRVQVCNYFDVFVASVLLMLLFCGAILVEAPTSSVKIQYIGSSILISLAVFISLGIGYGILHKLSPKAAFGHFVCHHKQGEAAQARLLQQLLEAFSRDLCFIDSDHLIDLGVLFDTVRSCLKNLVVYLGRDTLTRPWCVGEIVTAHVSGVHMIVVHARNFSPMQHTYIEHLSDVLGTPGVEVLSKYGIDMDHAKASLEHVQKLPFLDMSEQPRVHHFHSLVGSILQKSVGIRRVDQKLFEQRSRTRISLGGKSIFVCSALADVEATASAMILSSGLKKLPQNVTSNIVLLADTADPDVPTREDTQQVVLLSSSALVCNMCAYFVRRCWAAEANIVPVTLFGFVFPSDTFYEVTCEDLCQKLGEDSLYRNYTMTSTSLAVAYKELFNRIAITLNTHGKISIINAQVKEISQRMTTADFWDRINLTRNDRVLTGLSDTTQLSSTLRSSFPCNASRSSAAVIDESMRKLEVHPSSCSGALRSTDDEEANAEVPLEQEEILPDNIAAV